MEFLNAIKSVMAAFIGVQKKKNLEDDFAKSSATPFIVAGLIMQAAKILFIDWLHFNRAK